MKKRYEPRIHTISSGKGGVGKTLSTLHLAKAAAMQGHRVLVLDGDLGMANVDVLCSLSPRYTIEDFMKGFCSAADLVVKGPQKIDFILGSSGLSGLIDIEEIITEAIWVELSKVFADYDQVFIDSGAGAGSLVQSLQEKATSHIVVTTTEPHAITDAYSFIKKGSPKIKEFEIIVNMVHHEKEGLSAFERLESASQRFLGVKLKYLGAIPIDPDLSLNVRRRSVLGDRTSHTLAYQAFKSVYERFDVHV